MAEAAFVGAHPDRPERLASPWASLFNEHSRSIIAGWSGAAFSDWYTRRKVLGFTVHIPRHPDMIEHVLLGNVANYRKPKIVKKLLKPLLGNGLLAADGDEWRTQRKVVAPSFAPGAVGKLTGLIAAAAERHTRGWPASGAIDITETATDTTMAIIAEALFSGDRRLVTPEASRHITAALDAAGSVRIRAMLGLPEFGLTPRVRRGQAGRRYLRETLTAIVRERGADGGDDFLGGMIRDLHARFPAQEATTLAIDNAATFYLAGHETTANALAWSIYLLAHDSAVQERARAEAVAALDGDASTLPERLPYLRQVLDEALRLYPPAPRFDREAVAADMLGEHPVNPGDIVTIMPWIVHRHTRLWSDPDAFDPDRFAPGTEHDRHRFQYFPFGAGPRVCVGARFAIVEALVILAHWLAARRFTPDASREVFPVGSVTLRPKGGVWVKVEAV